MWKDENRNAPIIEFLGWVLFLSLLVEGILLLLEPCPVIALFITLRRAEKITVKEYFKRIIHTPKPLTAVLVTGLFCGIALIFALYCGTPNGSPWYMMPIGFQKRRDFAV